MLTTIKTFNGHALNDSDYSSAGLNFGTVASATLSFVELANADPRYAGVFTGQVRNLAIGIQILDTANRYILEAQLRSWFTRGVEGYLVVTFRDDGQDYQCLCVVQSFVPMSNFPGRFTVILQAGASTWSRVTAETDTWTANAATLSKTITVTGKDPTRLILSITPTAAAANGWLYQYLYQLVGKPKITMGKTPWCIELDTATLVTAGKLQADCDDLRIIVDGQEVKRWIADPNTTETHVWFNVNIGAGYSLTLKTAIASSGAVGELRFAVTPNNLSVLKALPNEFILVHGTEWFQCSGKDLSLYKVGVTARGALGTTMQAHASGDSFSYVQHVIYVLAGNAAAINPATNNADYDLEKPVFDLSQSDNTSWVYTASTLFYDATHPTRPGSWTPSVKRTGDMSEAYPYTQNGESGAPALGTLMSCWQRYGRWQNEAATLAWSVMHPAGISSLSATGSKYRSTVRWPTVRLERSVQGTTWLAVVTETTPVNISAWTALTYTSQTINGNYNWIRFVQTGSMAALADAASYYEILTATINFYTTNLPTGTLLSQVSNHPLAIRITNSTTGDALEIIHPMIANRILLIDGENFIVTYDSVNAHGAMALDDNSRDVWISLEAGSNTLIIEPVNTGDDIGTLSIALSWYPRRL